MSHIVFRTFCYSCGSVYFAHATDLYVAPTRWYSDITHLTYWSSGEGRFISNMMDWAKVWHDMEFTLVGCASHWFGGVEPVFFCSFLVCVWYNFGF